MSKRTPEQPLNMDLPHSAECERACLSAAMLSPEARIEVVGRLRPDDFHVQAHRMVFEALSHLIADGVTIDLRTMQAEMERRGTFEAAGGITMLAALDLDLPSLDGVPQYVRIVREQTMRRSAIGMGEKLIREAYRGQSTPSVILSRAALDVEEIQNNGVDVTERAVPIAVGADEFGETLDRPCKEAVGISSTIGGLDTLTQGFAPGQVWTLAARTGGGKSAFALQVARVAATVIGSPVAVVSLEMTRLEWVQRMVAAQASVPLTRIRSNSLSMFERSTVVSTMRDIRSAPLWIDDSGRTNAMDIGITARRLKAQHGLELLVIDYLQLMPVLGRYSNRTEAVAEISRSIKRLATELKVPVLALSQLSRASEERKEPELRDLRESGSIEQDADGVIFLHPTAKPEPSGDQQVELIVAKNRNGPTGRTQAVFHRPFMTFEESRYN